MAVRVLVQGFGEMGQEVVRTLEFRRDAELVGALDTDPEKVGHPVSDLLEGCRWPQVVIAHPAEGELPDADVAVHATTAFAAEALPEIEDLLRSGLDVVTICQELVFPVEDRIALAARLDEIAKRTGKTVVAAGVNPGWVLDVLPIAASLGCVDAREVRCRRVVDFSPYGPDEMKHIGAGLTAEEFEAGAEDGAIGHIGLLESAAMVAASLDLEVTRWSQAKEPLIASREHVTKSAKISPGQVRGFVQRVLGWSGEDEVAQFEMQGLLDPGDDDPDLGDHIQIRARPDVDLVVRSAIAQRGGEATAGVASNLIGAALAGEPGLIDVSRLPLARSRRSLAFQS